MKSFGRGLSLAVALFVIGMPAEAQNAAQESMTNEAVLKLLEAGLPAEAVVAKIKATRERSMFRQIG